MSIQSTKYVTREFAIQRIVKMLGYIYARSYRKIEAETTENYRLSKYVDDFATIDVTAIEEYTNTMLEDILDKPFIRESMFDNYRVVDELLPGMNM